MNVRPDTGPPVVGETVRVTRLDLGGTSGPLRTSGRTLSRLVLKKSTYTTVTNKVVIRKTECGTVFLRKIFQIGPTYVTGCGH